MKTLKDSDSFLPSLTQPSKPSSRRNFFSKSLAGGAAALTLAAIPFSTSTALAAVEGPCDACNDTLTDIDILNYALTLEHLENAFYRDGLRRFSKKDFKKSDLIDELDDEVGDKVYPYFRLIAEHERQDDAARPDLETSLKLLPTGAAYYALGNIASRQRNIDSAKQYYAAAAGSEGEIGQAAGLALMRLDLPQNPGKYVRTQAALDSGGMLVVAIGNPTSVSLTGLSVAVQYVDSQGRMRDFRRNYNGTLAAGQQVQIATGLGPFQNADQYRVALTSARIVEQ